MLNRFVTVSTIIVGSAGFVLVAASGCSASAPAASSFHGTGGSRSIAAHGGKSGVGGALMSTASGGTVITLLPNDSGPNGCQRLSCTPPGGQYCGEVGDGCLGKMMCPPCSNDWVCTKGLCKGGPSCVARTACTDGQTVYCGKIGDDCGGELDCGSCTPPATCGGSGVPGVCGDPACVPVSCKFTTGKGQYCGVIGNGCGGSLDCGACADGRACGGDGIPGVCPGSSGGLGCTGIKCNVEICSTPGLTTSVSGVVYDPAGVNPLYNVRVYIPNAPLDPIPTGATCEQCSANLSGQPITTALTDAKGHFKLENVPTGSNVPLVMQVGRWRRQVMLPKVTGCTENAINDRQLLRLPRNKQEGNMPLIAITTGGADALECIIPRIGIDRAEVTTDTGTGRVHLYAGGMASGPGTGATSMTPGGALPRAETLWSNPDKMRGYDLVMFSCEGDENRPDKTPYLKNFETYVNNGGRAFLTHYHYTWLNHSTTFQGTAEFSPGGLEPPEPVRGTINTSFPKGAALADWLVNVGATPTRGQLDIFGSKASVRTAIPPTQDWISLPRNPSDGGNPALQYMTFNTPIGAPPEQQCGRVVNTDLHIGALVRSGGQQQGGDTSIPLIPYPQGCANTPMSPQIKALEFIFFDLSACVQPDFTEPEPPPPPPTASTPPPSVPVTPPPPPPPPL